MKKDSTFKDDPINPKHYKSCNGKEVWEMMIDVWGEKNFAMFCEMMAFRYRLRAGKKENNDVEVDIKKAMWYEKKHNEMSTLPF